MITSASQINPILVYARHLSGGRQSTATGIYDGETIRSTARRAQLRPSIHRRATGFKEVYRKRHTHARLSYGERYQKRGRSRRGFKRLVTPRFPRRRMPFLLVTKNGTSTIRLAPRHEPRDRCIYLSPDRINTAYYKYLSLESPFVLNCKCGYIKF